MNQQRLEANLKVAITAAYEILEEIYDRYDPEIANLILHALFIDAARGLTEIGWSADELEKDFEYAVAETRKGVMN